jgi:hypothetical protein
MNDLARLEQSVERFCQFVGTLPPHALVDQAWGPKEVLAHLTYHHEQYVRIVEAFLAGAPVEPPAGRFHDLNAEAVAANRGVPSAELVSRLRQANQRLMMLYRQHDPNAITVQIKAGAKRWTLAELVPRVEAHIRNHQEKLRQDLRHLPEFSART